MADPPFPGIFPAAGQQLRPVPRRQFSPQSPTRPRPIDDLIADLAPDSAVAALRDPSDVLRRCLDGAAPSEKAFVMRTALASQTICEWLEELSDWPWPVGGGSSGFLLSVAESRRVIAGTEFLDSIPISGISQYDRRIEEISFEMEQLGIEEIKAHVLHNHILPLSRPGTPMSDSSRLTASALAYIRMEDLTAVITAIILQALPNLSKLSRLLNTWNIRISVLRQAPSFLSAVEDAEIALKSAWDALLIPSKTVAGEDLSCLRDDLGTFTTLCKKDSQIMRLVLEKKVTSPGRILDYMLDCLEGLEDTLPNEWLDRMEAVERGYSDWAVACDAKIREADWARSAAEQRRKSLLRPEEPKLAPRAVSPMDTVDTPTSDTSTQPVAASGESSVQVSVHDSTTEDLSQISQDSATIINQESKAKSEGPVEIIDQAGSSEDLSADEQTQASSGRGTDVESEDGGELPPLPSDMTSPPHDPRDALLPPASVHGGITDSPIIVAPEQTEMDDDTVSISSSPPLRGKPRASSVTFSDSLLIPSIEEDDEELRPSTPFTESFLEEMEESPSVAGTPSKRRAAVDDQLQQQISDILDGIPAKFTLTSEPSPVNLNPPDFKMPRMKKTTTTRDPLRDSLRSSMSVASSRASTPGFTLAPAYAKNTRPRQKSTQQDIKVYHLSRVTGEAPIKLFIRCVGESGERVMVRVGGGWADLGEYLKEYASHHGRRSKAANNDKVEIRDAPRAGSTSRSVIGSSPPSRPASAMEYSPMTPLHVKKTRKSFGASDLTLASSSSRRPPLPHTPAPAMSVREHTPSSGASTRSRSSSRLSWGEADSPMLGLAGPTSKPVEMSEESRAWVESVKEKVRIASGERKVSTGLEGREKLFGEMGKVGGTKRLFRKGQNQ
ncbi:hypothetical protein jhhlp_002598 [Lomentospora prolificans]|uniref:GAR domain-containing protein n=1 Tax=Lomentospora prolificans TaxID=41688 RepID=A0A2N3NEK9_9PEZI|nr:hypothetical protein jhhlp_002598 [Lomentospora prolificans]